jgi:hypothetical protein
MYTEFYLEKSGNNKQIEATGKNFKNEWRPLQIRRQFDGELRCTRSEV